MSTDLDPAELMRLATITTGSYEDIACPRCRSGERRSRYKLNVASLVTCQNCTLTYVNPRLSSPALQAKLQQWAAQDVVDEERLRIAFEPATLAYFGRFLERMTRWTEGTGRRLLDVGCSTGAFLSVARRWGWEANGLEIGAASSRYARQVLGLNVWPGSLYQVDQASASYDAIAMIEVIEHLPDPRAALERLHGWLKPGGVLLVTTPNFDSLYRRLFGSRWWVINCEDEHIVLFNLQTLSGMLEEAGYEVVEEHIQNLDVIGLVREALRRRAPKAASQSDPAQAVTGYYAGRSAKARVKKAMAGLGVLSAVRALLHLLDATYTLPYSPTRAWGEQLVVIARRKSV